MSELTLIAKPFKSRSASIFKVVFDDADEVGLNLIRKLIIENSLAFFKERNLAPSRRRIYDLFSLAMDGSLGSDLEVKANVAYLTAKDVVAYVYPKYFFVRKIYPVRLARYSDAIENRIKFLLRRINSVPNKLSIERVINMFVRSDIHAHLSEDEFLSNKRSLLVELSDLFNGIVKSGSLKKR